MKLLIIVPFWIVNANLHPQNWGQGLGEFHSQNGEQYINETLKYHTAARVCSASFEPSGVKVFPYVWLVGEYPKKV